MTPKYEKVDDHTIKITMQHSQEVPLSQVLRNKKTLLHQKEEIEQALKQVDELLKIAEDLGVTPEEIDV